MREEALVPTRPLPENPSLEQLRNRARDLQRAARSDPRATELLAQQVPGLAGADPLPLHVAQLALARSYGFSSWTRLRQHLAVVAEYSRDPASEISSTSHGDPIAAFLMLAVLSYTDADDPSRWQRARDLLAAQPDLVARSIHGAAAAGDPAAVGAHLDRDPAGATRAGGPMRWEPLLYLTYSRVGADSVQCAELLMAAGADPNAGYLWRGLPTPFTALTGVFGHGELGEHRQAAHPQQDALARRLLAHGADPNDGQTLYNRMFARDDSHLRLLFEYGLGTGDGGPWHRRMPEVTDSPEQLLRAQLTWAITHGMPERIALLAEHGVDLTAPLSSGHLPITTVHTPLELARLAGRADVVRLLQSLGAGPQGAPGAAGPGAAVHAAADPLPELVAALLEPDLGEVDRLLGTDPNLLDRCRRERPSLVLRAAVLDQPMAAELLVQKGFDPDARGRSDIVTEQPWETALHHAAAEGYLDMVTTLLRLGADPEVRDRRFDATPLDWARHFHQDAVARCLQDWSTPGPPT